MSAELRNVSTREDRCCETPQPARETRALPKSVTRRIDSHLSLDFRILPALSLAHHAKPDEPDEQFRVYLDPDVDHHRPRCDEPPGWHRTRFLPAPTESDGRSPRCFHCRYSARPRFKRVGRIYM